MKKATTSILICLLFLGMSLGNKGNDYKEQKIKKNSIDKNLRENIIEQASIKFSNSNIDKSKDKTKDISINKQSKEKQVNQVLISSSKISKINNYQNKVDNQPLINTKLSIKEIKSQIINEINISSEKVNKNQIPINSLLDIRAKEVLKNQKNQKKYDLKIYNNTSNGNSYRALYNISVGGGSYDSEISWSVSQDGVEVLAGLADDYSGVELADGEYVLTMIDSYGDGWNGGSWNISTSDGNLYTFLLESGSELSVDFSLPGEVDTTVYGCMLEGASNYNPDAEVDDGSCNQFAGAEFVYWNSAYANYYLDCNIYYIFLDSDGDGIVDAQGNGDCDEALACDVFFCDNSDCEDCSGDCLGTDLASTECWNGSIVCNEEDCPASCENTECLLTMNDSYGDGWNGNIWESGDQSGTIDDGDSASITLCFDLGSQNDFSVGGGSYASEVSWFLDCGENLSLSGFAPESGCFGDCSSSVPGCTDQTAENYNSDATSDDGSCTWNGGCISSSYVSCADGSECILSSYFCDGSSEYGNANWGPDCDDGSDEGAQCCESGDYLPEICVEDCSGEIFGSSEEDCTGICGGNALLDGNGDCCESGYLDECGICDGTGDTCDCSGYTINVGGGSYDSEISWEIVADSGGDDGGAGECVDTDSGAVDSYGDGCDAYNSFPSWCGNYDDDDFMSNEMCCICGGGEGGGADGAEAVASGSAGIFEVCIPDGSYTFNGFDSWGDGWNGGTAVITNAGGDLLYTFIVEGSSGTWSMELPGEIDTNVYGCTFEDAPNYNPEADLDDGSCEIFAGATCGNGGYFAPWLAYFGYIDCSTNYCGYDLDENGLPDGVGNDICENDTEGTLGADYTCFDCDGGDCLDCNGDCTGTEEGSVECWDGSYACSEDDCPELCGDSICELLMSDSYGDGWNGATFSSGDQIASLESGSEGSALLCFDLSSSNNFTVGGGSYDSEISWYLDCADGNPLSGGAPFSGCVGTDCSEPLTCEEEWDACVDSLVGTEYYEACSAEDCVGGPGGECDGNVVPGLSDECATVAFNVGSGECEDPCGGGGDDGGGPDLCFGVVIAMFDAWGDGWNGNVLTIGDETFSLDETTDGDGLSSGTACYEGPVDVVVTCGGGSYQSEVSWAIYDYTGSVLLDGGAPYEGCLGDCSGGTDDGGADDGGAGDCVDTDNGAVDSYGDGCDAYNSFPSWCGNYDDDDFQSLDMCCICGGGDSSGTGDGGDDGGDDCLLGDNNDDETINVQDIILVVNYIMGTSTDDLPCGDMNDDGAINVQDIVTVVNIIMGTSARVDSATEATLVIRNNDLLLRSNGFVQGIQLTLSHGDDFSINLEEEYISETLTSRNHTKIVLVTDGLSTLDKIGDTNGAYTILSSIVSDNNANSILTNQITEITDFMLTDAFPNPFNPTTNLSLVLSEAGYVSVKIYNIVGQEVAVLAEGIYEANLNGHQLTWDASNVSSGVYIVRAESLGQISTQKLMLLK